MLQSLGRTASICGGVSRRQLLQAGGAGLLGLSLPKLLQAEEALLGQKTAALRPRAKSVIFLFLFGGPSQLETWDMKPLTSSTIRGPFSPIASRTPDLHLCERLPRCAAISDQFAVLRTMSHDYNDHSGAGHFIQTGKRWQIPVGGGFNATPQDWPSIGSVVEYLDQNVSRDGLRSPETRGQRSASENLPGYVVLPNKLGKIQSTPYSRPGEYAGWLGRAYDPITTSVDKANNEDNPYFRQCSNDELTFQIEGLLTPQSMTLDRLHARQSLLGQYEQQLRGMDNEKTWSVYDRYQRRALSLVTSAETRNALDLNRESVGIRDRYGRHLFGQSTLMARRLVEAGVRYVTVHWDAPDGYSWDSHINSQDLGNHLMPGLDQALSALLTDLKERGLLDETLVVCLGEMGRTPRTNATWGRGHWSTLFPAVIAGAGIRGGIVLGQSDKDAAYAVTPPYKPADLAATIYHALGISQELRLPDTQGRPVPIMDGGQPIVDLFG